MSDREINLLSLDGGGVRGLSSLIILQHLMEAIDPENPPRPCDHFDLIGGSGSGGLIAILLGRLEMDIPQCIRAYKAMVQDVFPEKKMWGWRSRGKCDIKRVELAIRCALRKYGFERDELFREGGGEDQEEEQEEEEGMCRVFVCATENSTRKLVHMTSYASKYTSNELYKNTKVFEAACASFAYPSLFGTVKVGPSGRQYHDSTQEANNPMREVWIEARGIWPEGALEDQLRCMVSIGTGEPLIRRARKRQPGLAKALHSDAVDMNRFIQEHTELDDEDRLFRFDVPNGLAEIAMDDIGELSTIVDATESYLERELVYKQVRRCAAALSV
ncbi:acyl transferase/acyl hydrolase/lysophospholipase [Aspergillus avenaceus]|uniref:Acyl transferase/acyl hydrolase/lysophospholipase n=1 Tax=Aspergillus avenaceus TaxID=36643 RepID=A0A5N6TRA3_ASPAV|nr:acyl transferase/acyl hydrolase/lysophospholipase [Aspergillus avenaceus]